LVAQGVVVAAAPASRWFERVADVAAFGYYNRDVKRERIIDLHGVGVAYNVEDWVVHLVKFRGLKMRVGEPRPLVF